jgi:hypothetical protein
MISNIFIFSFFIFQTVISSPSCTNNANHCIHCDILTNLCAKCEHPEIFVPDNKGGCEGAQKCIVGKNNCYECDKEGKLCETCETNYYPDENGGCTYTEGCKISYMGECLECNPDYILIGKEGQIKICKYILIDNFKNCEEINYETGYCNICKEGYYLTVDNKRCIKTENCKESIFGNCVICDIGYYLNKKEDKCEKSSGNFTYCKETIDGNNCDTCIDGYYFDDNGICVPTKFCAESENFKCKKCQKGKYFENNYSSNICTNTEHCNNAVITLQYV